MRKLYLTLLSAITIGGLIASPQALAINAFDGACNGGAADSAVCKGRGEQAQPIVQSIITTILMILGIVAVVALIYGGFRFVTSNGDSSKVKQAKDIVLYSVAGLVVAILAYAIVDFTLRSITK